jgi:hypothetical protein
MDWLSQLIHPLFNNWFSFFASPTIAIFALVATIYGLVRHRNRRNLWWIISCAAVSLLAFVLTALLLAIAFSWNTA